MPSNDYYTVSVRVQQSERLACKRAAEIAGTTVSAWSRQKLLAALRPDDYVEQVDEQPEDAAQEGDADVADNGVFAELPDNGDSSALELYASPIPEALEKEAAEGYLAEPAPATVSEQPLTYRKTDLCSRCQRIGPSCSACRTLIRGRRLA